MFYNTAQIGGAIISGAAEIWLCFQKFSRGADLIQRVESGFIPED